MNKLDEIAQRVAKEMYGTEFLLEHETKFGRKLLTELLAELSKDAEPECWGISLHGILCDTYVFKEHAVAEFNRRNDTFPDEARRLVELFPHPFNTAEIEQRTAEAIAQDNESLRAKVAELEAEVEAAKNRNFSYVAREAEKRTSLQTKLLTEQDKVKVLTDALESARNFVWKMSSSVATRDRFDEIYYPAINSVGAALATVKGE